MKQAVQLARKSPQRNKHGCVIVNKKQIVGGGHNTYCSKFKGGSSFTSLHAEISAINNIPRYLLWDAEIYIVHIVEDTGNKIRLGNSHPCKDCAKKLSKFKKFRIKIYYSVSSTIYV